MIIAYLQRKFSIDFSSLVDRLAPQSLRSKLSGDCSVAGLAFPFLQMNLPGLQSVSDDDCGTAFGTEGVIPSPPNTFPR